MSVLMIWDVSLIKNMFSLESVGKLRIGIKVRIKLSIHPVKCFLLFIRMSIPLYNKTFYRPKLYKCRNIF